MNKGKKIAIVVAVIIGITILVVGTLTKPKQSAQASNPANYASSQIEKLRQLEQLTTKLYNDETITDMAQLKSEINQISGSQDSLYNAMLSNLEANKSYLSSSKYEEIKDTLTNKVQPSYKQVVADAEDIVKNGYDKTPSKTVENYQNAMSSMVAAENIIAPDKSQIAQS